MQVLENMRALLTEAGADFSKVAKTTIYLADMGDFAVGQRDLRHLFQRAVSRRGPPCRSRACRATCASRSTRSSSSTEPPRAAATALAAGLSASPRAPRPAPRPRCRSDLITFSRCFMSLISTVTSMRAWVSAPVVASRLRMLVLMSAMLALSCGQHALAILDLHRQPHGVGRGVAALVPLDVDAALRVVEQVDDVGTGRRVHRHALAAGDVADDLLAADRVAAARARHHQVVGAAHRDAVGGRRAGPQHALHRRHHRVVRAPSPSARPSGTSASSTCRAATLP